MVNPPEDPASSASNPQSLQAADLRASHLPHLQHGQINSPVLWRGHDKPGESRAVPVEGEQPSKGMERYFIGVTVACFVLLDGAILVMSISFAILITRSKAQEVEMVAQSFQQALTSLGKLWLAKRQVLPNLFILYITLLVGILIGTLLDGRWRAIWKQYPGIGRTAKPPEKREAELKLGDEPGMKTEVTEENFVGLITVEPSDSTLAEAQAVVSQNDPSDASDLQHHQHLKIFPDQANLLVHEPGKLRESWQVIGASRRGSDHLYERQYREDDFEVRLIGKDLALVAIADGVGGAGELRLSRRGARAAVLGAVSIAKKREVELMALAAHVRNNAGDQNCSNQAQELLMECFQEAQRIVEVRALLDNVNIKQLHSTLLVFLAIPHSKDKLFLASIQIGDGALYALADEENTSHYKWYLLQPPQIQPDGNDVQPLMSSGPENWASFFRCVPALKSTFIMGVTDGIDECILPPRTEWRKSDPDRFVNVQDFYEHLLVRVLSGPEPSVGLGEFIGFTKLGASDDRTVICMYRQEQVNTHGS